MSAIPIPPIVSLQERHDQLQKRFDALLDQARTTAANLDMATSILDALAQGQAFEEPEDGLVLLDGTQAPRENPVVVVSITVNGKGVRTSSTFARAAVEENGWPQVLAQACQGPLGLMVRELAK